MVEFSRGDFGGEMPHPFGDKEVKAPIADHSFYGNEIEPLTGFEKGRQAYGNINQTMNEDYNEQTLHTILPTIKQHKQMSDGFRPRGFTKPSTLGNMSSYQGTKR